MKNSLREKLIVERQQDAIDQLAHLMKDCDDRLTLQSPKLAERYVEGRLKGCLKFRIGQAGGELHCIFGRCVPSYGTEYNAYLIEGTQWLFVVVGLAKIIVNVSYKMSAFPGAYGENAAFQHNERVHIRNSGHVDWYKADTMLIPLIQKVDCGQQDVSANFERPKCPSGEILNPMNHL